MGEREESVKIDEEVFLATLVAIHACAQTAFHKRGKEFLFTSVFSSKTK